MRKGNHSNFLTPTVVGGRRPLPCEICAQNDPTHFEKRAGTGSRHSRQWGGTPPTPPTPAYGHSTPSPFWQLTLLKTK